LYKLLGKGSQGEEKENIRQKRGASIEHNRERTNAKQSCIRRATNDITISITHTSLGK
jgi:hypothetical protein